MSVLLDSISGFFGSDPALRAGQLLVMGVSVLLLFLLFYTLKDVFLRVRSFWLQALFLLMVALLPIAGFLLYILLRPHRTLKERETEMMLREILASLHPEPAVVPEEAVPAEPSSPAPTTPTTTL